MILQLTATREGKLSSFLRGELRLSYGLLKRLKYLNAYQVNGQAAHTDHRVKPGDHITVTMEEALPDLPIEHAPLSILHEDDALIALDKPPGMLVHPSFNRVEGTLVNRLLGHYQRTGQKCAVHLVNRLDRDTFGVVLVAKKAYIHAMMCDALKSGRVKKIYHAAVYGRPPDEKGSMRMPIARVSSTSLLRCVRADGKDALTHYVTLQANDACALLQLEAVTGRTHQLRVHCANSGFPILGDSQYGTDASQAFSKAQGIAQQQLCATSLCFAHPLTNAPLAIHSALSVTYP